MEMVALVVALVVVTWFFGFLKSIRAVADMANKEVAVQATLHNISCAKRLAVQDGEATEQVFTKAQKVVDDAKGFKL